MKSYRSYPRSIDIEGNKWTIKFKRKIIHEKSECDGLCDSTTKTIYIRIKKDYSDMFRVLIHEVLHAIEFENKHDIPHKHIEQLDSGLARFLVKNYEKIKNIIK